MDQLLKDMANQAGKKTMNAYNMITHNSTLGTEAMRPAMSSEAAQADELVSHATAAWQDEFLRWRAGNFSRIGVMRDPIDQRQSYFRFCGGAASTGHPKSESCSIPAIHAKNLTLQQGYEQTVTGDQHCRPRNGNLSAPPQCLPDDSSSWSAPYYFAPNSVFENKGLKPGLMTARIEHKHEHKHEHKRAQLKDLDQTALTPEEVTTIVSYVVERYGVFGVLERGDETLEVIRCRLPWLAGATEYPHSRPTPPYPEQLTNDPVHTQLIELTANSAKLFIVANLVLSADVACCRAARERQG